MYSMLIKNAAKVSEVVLLYMTTKSTGTPYSNELLLAGDQKSGIYFIVRDFIYINEFEEFPFFP